MIERVFDNGQPPSPIEEHLAALLIAHGMDTRWTIRAQEPVWGERQDWPRYILDFTLAGDHAVINVECDGEQWHQNRAYDAERDDYVVRVHGVHRVERFSGTEIYRAGAEIVAYLDVLLWAMDRRGWIVPYLVRPTARQKPDGTYEAYLPIAGTAL